MEGRFSDFIGLYLNNEIGGYMPSTIAKQCLKIAMFGRRLEEFKEAGYIETTDPRIMEEKEIHWFIQDMKNWGLDVSIQKKYVEMMNNIFQYLGNKSVEP